MRTRLLDTDLSTTRFVQRLVLATVMLPHGAQKLLGWFGGYGFSGTMGYLTGKAGLPYPVALIVILAESVGAILLALGVLSRVTALGIAAVMVGAVATVHGRVGFFMNWGGAQGGEGFEYHLLALALAVPIVVAGGGRYALDRVLARRVGATRGTAGAAVPAR
jgi:putative oxidoreductase